MTSNTATTTGGAQDRELVTISEAARIVNLSGARIRQLCDNGELEHLKTPYGRLIFKDALLEYARRREAGEVPVRKKGGQEATTSAE